MGIGEVLDAHDEAERRKGPRVYEHQARNYASGEIPILDHGYVKLIETWGSDERIVEAARMSTDKGFLGWGPLCDNCGAKLVRSEVACPVCEKGTSKNGDEKLLKYLYDHKHATPFEMAGMVIEVKAPIFVFREWHRHRTQGYNETSARYVPLPDENYVPTVERLLMNSKTNRQAGTVKGAEELAETRAEELMIEERAFNAAAERFYQKKLQAGVPKELARTHLGVSRYSKMRATACLRNWLAFLTLRMDTAAQWEIRQYANEVGNAFIAAAFPRTWELFSLGRAPIPLGGSDEAL